MRLLLAVLLALVVSACGSTTTTAVPSAQPPAGTGTPGSSPQPTATAGSPSGQPSPLGHAAPDLEARLPGRVGDTALSKASGTGGDVFRDDPWSRAMTAFLAGVGKKPADFRFAQAWDPAEGLDLELGAFQVDGVDAAALRQALVDSSRAGSPGISTATATLSGKPLTTVMYPGNPSTLYLYEVDGLVIYVGTPDESLAAQVLAALP